jgi:hypothetical protein
LSVKQQKTQQIESLILFLGAKCLKPFHQNKNEAAQTKTDEKTT